MATRIPFVTLAVLCLGVFASILGSEVATHDRGTASPSITPPIAGAPFRNSDEQWIEVYNRGASAVDLSGWEFSDGVSFVFPAATTIV